MDLGCTVNSVFQHLGCLIGYTVINMHLMYCKGAWNVAGVSKL